MDWVLLLPFFWVVGSILAGFIAHEKGRDALRYGLWALFFSPFFFGLLLIALPSLRAQKIVFADEVDANKKSHLTCPRCAEFVKLKAQVCRYCGCDLTEEKRKLFDAADAQDRAKKIS